VRSSLVALDDLLASTNAAGTRVSDLVGPAFVCDLDRFKLVNDTLGHRTGDELLQAVGQRLWTTVEGSGTRIFRLGGDDFGNGYSTIVRLIELPVDVVKLDRALVAGVAAGDDAAFGILSAAVALVTHAGLEIVVEGVETQSELDAVRQLGCTIVQGYLFRRPGPAHEVLDEERTSGGLGSDRGGATGATRSN
jgi:predicted signal transduction protein with EAL and GGDEF domain